jgi:hypothetical protein
MKNLKKTGVLILMLVLSIFLQVGNSQQTIDGGDVSIAPPSYNTACMGHCVADYKKCALTATKLCPCMPEPCKELYPQ